MEKMMNDSYYFSMTERTNDSYNFSMAEKTNDSYNFSVAACAEGEFYERIDWNPIPGKGFTPSAVTLALALPNLLVVAQILSQKLYQSPSFLLLFNLALGDIAVGLLTAALLTANRFLSTDFIHLLDIRCHFCKVAAAFALLKINSSFTIVLLSLDRLAFFRLRHEYERTVTLKVTCLSLCVAWILSICLAIPPLAERGDAIFYFPCGPEFLADVYLKRSFSYLVGICVVIGVVSFILVTSNTWVLHITLQQIKAYKNLQMPLGGQANGEGQLQVTETGTNRDEQPGPGLQALATQNASDGNEVPPHLQDQRCGGDSSAATREPGAEWNDSKYKARKQIRLYMVFCGVFMSDAITYTVSFVGAFLLLSKVQLEFDEGSEFLDYMLMAMLVQVLLHPVMGLYLVPELHHTQSLFFLIRCFRPSSQTMSDMRTHYQKRKWLCTYEALWVSALASELDKENVDTRPPQPV